MIAAIQTREPVSGPAASPPRSRARSASAVTETGWFSANTRSHDGIDLVGTNAELTNTSGNITKEALLNAALVQALAEFGEELGRALTADAEPGAGQLARFDAAWTRVIESFAGHRPLWAASFEIMAEIGRAPEPRAVLADAMTQERQGRLGLAQVFHGIDGAVDERTVGVVGSFYQALITGVVAQWLTDPAHAPSARDLTDALRTIAADIGSTTATGPAQSAAFGPPATGPATGPATDT